MVRWYRHITKLTQVERRHDRIYFRDSLDVTTKTRLEKVAKYYILIRSVGGKWYISTNREINGTEQQMTWVWIWGDPGQKKNKIVQGKTDIERQISKMSVLGVQGQPWKYIPWAFNWVIFMANLDIVNESHNTRTKIYDAQTWKIIMAGEIG